MFNFYIYIFAFLYQRYKRDLKFLTAILFLYTNYFSFFFLLTKIKYCFLLARNKYSYPFFLFNECNCFYVRYFMIFVLIIFSISNEKKNEKEKEINHTYQKYFFEN